MSKLSRRARTGRWLIASSILFLCLWVILLANVGWTAMSGSVFVTVTIGDGIVDLDEDGMDDDWERDQFGDTTTATATSDYDLDGSSDLCEYLAGTDPKDPDSLLRIESIEILSPMEVRIVWQSSTNTVPALRRYDIYYADTVDEVREGGTALQLNVPSEGSESDVEDTAGAHQLRFYRVHLHQ